jgi:hypothetical protein
VALSEALGETEAEAAAVADGRGVAEAERVAVEESVRRVSVAATETETLAVAEGVRTVSVAAGEALPAPGLALPRLLPVPPREALSRALGEAWGEGDSVAVTLLVPACREGLCRALGEAVVVGGMVGGSKVTDGETVLESERMVMVAGTEADTLGQALKEAVGDIVRTVSVAAGEALAGAGLALPRVLLEERAVALSKALGESEAEAAAVADGREVVAGERVAVEEGERRVAVARMEAEALGQVE